MTETKLTGYDLYQERAKFYGIIPFALESEDVVAECRYLLINSGNPPKLELFEELNHAITYSDIPLDLLDLGTGESVYNWKRFSRYYFSLEDYKMSRFWERDEPKTVKRYLLLQSCAGSRQHYAYTLDTFDDVEKQILEGLNDEDVWHPELVLDLDTGIEYSYKLKVALTAKGSHGV